MNKEIKFNFDKVDKGDEYTILYYIDSDEEIFKTTTDKTKNFDYLMLIERNGNSGLLMCWNDGYDEEDVVVYKVRIQDK